MKSEQQIRSVFKRKVNIREEYSNDEIIDAILMNDASKLDEIRSRVNVLNSAYAHFCEEMDSGDDERRMIAISSFKRPKK